MDQTRIDQLKRLLQAEPEDAFCLYSLGLEHAKGGDTTAAVSWFDRAIAADPTMAYAYFHKARALEEADEMSAAAETLQAGLDCARAHGDQKAASELAGYLDQIT